MRYIYLGLIFCLLALALNAQTTGSMQQIGDKTVLQVWGTHYQRGHAQGYLLGNRILDVFNQYYYPMVTMSNPVYYNYMWNYYQEHFNQDARMFSEAQGMINGMQDAGISVYHSGLQRNLEAEDVMLVNAIVDMILVRSRFTDEVLQLGCSSLSSWGISTQQDSLLMGNAVITRFLDWSQNTALISNPLLVVHHPSETDEQKWLSFTYPGLIGALSGISESGTSGFLNMGNDHTVQNSWAVDPVLFDLRRGIERYDYDGDGLSTSLDIHAAISEGHHLSGTIIHALSENGDGQLPLVTETNNSGTALRYYDQNGNLPGNHLAATNHFRVLSYPVCCDRYNNIQDSLLVNHQMTAKRQWQVLSGAAGLETNLGAIQYTPSTGALLWSSATFGLPAYQTPALTLNTNDLFNFNVHIAEDQNTPAVLSFRLYPNPVTASGKLNLSSDFDFSELRMFNLRGQLVHSQTTGKQRELGLSLPKLPAGVYLIRLSDDQGRAATRKLLLHQ